LVVFSAPDYRGRAATQPREAFGVRQLAGAVESGAHESGSKLSKLAHSKRFATTRPFPIYAEAQTQGYVLANTDSKTLCLMR
jgi:hypothetical protein